jgi:peroxiredoxin
MLKKILMASVIAAALLAGCTDRKAPAGGSMASDFTLQDLNGKSVRLSDMKGKVVLLEFWATWCPPCRASIPGLEKIHQTYKDKGLVVLAVSMDEGGWDSVKAFAKQYGITYTVLKGDDDVATKYQVRSIPMMLVLDKTGKIARRYLGMGSDEALEEDIKAVL